MEDEEQEELPALRFAALLLLAGCAAAPADEGIPSVEWLHGRWVVDAEALRAAEPEHAEEYGDALLVLETGTFRVRPVDSPYEILRIGSLEYEATDGAVLLHLDSGETLRATRSGDGISIDDDALLWQSWQRHTDARVSDAPDITVTEYTGLDSDNLSIPTAAWLHGPWMVDDISLEGMDLDWYGIDDVERMHWVVLTFEPQGYRLQSMKPPYEVYSEGKTRYEPQGNGEFHLHFDPGGTVEASRFGLTLFLNGDDVPWHVWERPSADPRWMPAREAHAAEMQNSKE